MPLDPVVFLFVLLGSVIVGGIAVLAARGFWQRTMLFGIFAGLWFYSGVGAASPEVPDYYLLYYFGFLVAFGGAFWFFKVAFTGVSVRSGRLLTQVLAGVDHHPRWRMVIWFYVLLQLVPLVYPEFRLHHLLAPQIPDLTTFWLALFQPQEVDIVLTLVEYASLLLTPFFYVALFRYRQHIRWVTLIVLSMLYIDYVQWGYIARNTVMMHLGLIWLALWVIRPRYRPAMVIGTIALVPLILVASYAYQVIRIGGVVGELSPVEAAVRAVEIETDFLRNVGMPLIESGARVNLTEYATWIITLPIPKIITGEISGARINYEISELILGRGPGEKGWYVVLSGLVPESVYIGGPYFFWVHAVFIAFLAALIVRLLERTPQLLFLQAYMVLLFAFILNRAGIGALLPVVVNQFLLFYLYVFVVAFGLFRKRAVSVVLQNCQPACMEENAKA